MSDRIMYICTDCAAHDPENCGYFDRNMLRVMDDGNWACDACFDNRDLKGDDERCWNDFDPPPVYGPLPSDQCGGGA